MTVSERIKIARELIGIGQSEASMRSGLKQKDISLLENGKKKFIPGEYIQFLYNEGIDLNSIFSDDENVKVNKHVPGTLTDSFNEEQVLYKRIPQGLKADNSKEFVSPTVSPTPGLGAKSIYLTPQIITVDNSGTDNILYVPVRAAAGYLNGYADAEFIETLPSFTLPGLQNSTYRAFEVSGDSMWPTLENKEMIIGQWVEKLDYIREDRVHILVTKNDGIIVKRLLNRIDKYGYVIAKSDAVNDRNLYPNIEVHPDDILEIWYAVWHGGFNFKAPGDLWKRQNNLEADLADVLRRLKHAGL